MKTKQDEGCSKNFFDQGLIFDTVLTLGKTYIPTPEGAPWMVENGFLREKVVEERIKFEDIKIRDNQKYITVHCKNYIILEIFKNGTGFRRVGLAVGSGIKAESGKIVEILQSRNPRQGQEAAGAFCISGITQNPLGKH